MKRDSAGGGRKNSRRVAALSQRVLLEGLCVRGWKITRILILCCKLSLIYDELLHWRNSPKVRAFGRSGLVAS